MEAPKDWKGKGAMWLLPSELREMRTLLLSAGALEDVELWVFILLSIDLFLCFNKGDNMCTSHFKKSSHTVSNSKISALALRIKGKCAHHWNSMHLWRDDHTDPELCPIRHLLICMFMRGICQGPLCLGHEELNSCSNGLLSDGGDCKTKLGCDTVHLGLQQAAKNVLKVRNESLKKTIQRHLAPAGQAPTSEPRKA
jgi:hypothetical protein